MKRLALALLCGIAAALPLGAVGQTAEGPQHAPGASDKGLVVAPQAPAKVADQANATADRAIAAGPTNICRELTAFLQPKPAPGPQPAAGGQPGPNPASSAAGPSVQGSGQPAPVPQAPTAATPSPAAAEEATAVAQASDLAGCQKAVQNMRRAGVALPAGLIALAAMKPELLGIAKP
jgi:hypothetical protein